MQRRTPAEADILQHCTRIRGGEEDVEETVRGGEENVSPMLPWHCIEREIKLSDWMAARMGTHTPMHGGGVQTHAWGWWPHPATPCHTQCVSSII